MGKERSDVKAQSIRYSAVVWEDCCADRGIIEGSALQNEKHTGTCPHRVQSPTSLPDPLSQLLGLIKLSADPGFIWNTILIQIGQCASLVEQKQLSSEVPGHEGLMHRLGWESSVEGMQKGLAFDLGYRCAFNRHISINKWLGPGVKRVLLLPFLIKRLQEKVKVLVIIL